MASPQVKTIKFRNFLKIYGQDNRLISSVWNRGATPRYTWQTFPLDLVGAAYLRSQGAKEVEDEEEYSSEEEAINFGWVDSWVTEEEKQVEEEEEIGIKAAGGKAQMEVSFELNPPPIKKETYLIKAADPENLLKVESAAEVTFGPNGAIKKATFDLILPKSVQRFKSLIWECKKKGEKPWKWMEETYLYKGEGEESGGGIGVGFVAVRLKDPEPVDEDYSENYEGGGIYVTLKNPVGVMKDQLRIELLNVAGEQAKGAKTAQEVREKLTSGVFNWLSARDFGYFPNYAHLKKVSSRAYEFELTDFLQDISRDFYTVDEHGIAKKGGNCVDISTFYRFACNAVGARMWCHKVVGNPERRGFYTNRCIVPGVKEREGDLPWMDIIFRIHPFSMHQFGNLKGAARYVWDPTLQFETSPAFAARMLWEEYTIHLTLDPVKLGDIHDELLINCVKSYQTGGKDDE